MEWKGPIKAISVELPEDLHAEMKSAAPRRKMFLRDAYVKALSNWLANDIPVSGDAASSEVLGDSPHRGTPGRTSKTPRGETTINPTEYSEWIKMLEGILTSGHAVAIEALIRNLQAFNALVRSDAEGKVGNYKVPKPSDLARDLAGAAERLKGVSAAARRRNETNTG